MDTRFLESLIAVVEGGSIAAAARLQGLTPAAVGQRVKALEAQLDVQLMERSGHQARPTAATLALLPHARRVLQETRALAAAVDADGLAGELRLGAVSTLLTDEVPGLLRQLAGLAPKARIEIVPGTSRSLYDRLLARELDGVLSVAPPFELPKSIEKTELFRQPYMLVSHAEGPVDARAALARGPVLLYQRTAWGGRPAWEWLSEQRGDLDILCEMDALEAIALLVEQRMGVAVLPKWRGLADRHPALRLTEIPAIAPRPIVLMTGRPAPAGKLLAQVARLLREGRPHGSGL